MGTFAVKKSSTTNHGGTISSSGSANVKVNSEPAIMETGTDKVSCPITGHDNPFIATGSSTVLVNTKAMVRGGDTVSAPCGGTFTTGLSTNVKVG